MPRRDDWEVEFGLHRFAYKELYESTGYQGQLLGTGGFGWVYKGALPQSRDCGEAGVGRLPAVLDIIHVCAQS